jgi:hypothetical protein
MPIRPPPHRSPRSILAAVAALASVVAGAGPARADGKRAVAPRGGGLDAVEVTLGADASVGVRRCTSADCSDAGRARPIPIPLDRSRLDLAHHTLEVIPIGEGRSVVHVRVPDVQRPDLAFEAIVGARDDEPIFAGLTGYTRGEEGDRSGQVVLTYPGEGGSKFVIVADVREDTRICGQAVTPLRARGLDPRTMQLRGATLHRIDEDVRDGATRVVAQPRPKTATAPLARLLVATGGSAPGAQALTDGDATTTWSEQRPGDGHGEFVTMRAPPEAPIARVVLTIAPPSPSPAGAAPRTLFLATDAKTFRVTMPEDAWRRPGASYEIPLPEPVRTSCLAIVLDEAYAQGSGTPEVSIAEAGALTRFDLDGASLDDLTRELAGARGEEAAAVLRRSGDGGLAAVTRRWSSLDERGRALAVDVAASAGSCDGPAIELLAQALTDRDREVKKRALGRIERCGRAAGETLAKVVRAGDEPTRAAAAPLLASIAATAAVEPIAAQLGKGAPDTRRALRAAFARAAASAPREKLVAILADAELAPAARLDLLRAAASRLAQLRPEADAALAAVLRSSPDVATRYLALSPLAELARSPDATEGELSRLASMARADPDWPVRMRAVELSAGIAPLASTIVAAASDPAPRVREAAMQAIGAGKIAPGGAEAAARALAGDPWTFVRVAAADALGASAVATGQGALGAALGDRSPKVRAAAIGALGKLHATSFAEKIRERLDDAREDVDVRALAARTLGAMCVKGAADRLTKLAALALAPVDDADERIGMAAIDGLTALHPPDLGKRLAPLREKGARSPVKRAAERALTDPGVCR